MLDPEICYQAHRRRDPGYDGLFFTAVLTTGVYCRPVCPARTPLRRNVRFFVTAAEAEAAGFRPCLRCRPDAVPGSPAWEGTAATVSRGSRLIRDGAVDQGRTDALAGRLGLGERQVRRLFRRHAGETPAAMLRRKRLEQARQLLEETGLTVTEICHQSGFSSLRAFQDAFRQAYGCAPTELRKRMNGS